MSISTIREALSNKDRAVVQAVRGTIKVVYPQNQTPSGKAVQNAIFQDADAECRITFWERDADLSELTGKTIVISSTKGPNGRQSGVSVRATTDYKTGAPALELSISENADIKVETETAAQSQANPTPAAAAAKQTNAPAAASDPRIQSPTAKASLEDVVALFGQCYRSAHAILPLNPATELDGPTLQALQAAAATLFIAARQEGLTPGAAKRDPISVAAHIGTNQPL